MKWPEVALNNIASIGGGSTPSRDHIEYWNGSIPWLTPTDLPMPGTGIADVYETSEYITEEGLKSCAANLVPPGTVLFSSRATIGKIGIARVPLTTNQGFINFIPNRHIESKYLAYILLFFTSDITRLAGSTTFKEVPRGSIKPYRIHLPPLSEQRRIVEILDQADALRKKRSEADTKAERILPTLFYKMFGDPAKNPKGWEETTLSGAGADVRYGLGQPPKTVSDGLSLIRATNVDHGRIKKENMLYVNKEDVPESRNAFLSADEVIVVRSGAYTGDVAQVTDRWAGSVAGYDLVVNPGNNLVGEYVESSLLTPHIQNNYFGNLKARAGQPHLNAEQLSKTPVLRPPKPLQLQYAKQVKCIRDLREKIAKSDETISTLFSVLLHRVFSGELTSQWREAHMKELLVEMELQAKALNLKVEDDIPESKNNRHGGYDMFNKAALASYITYKCHSPQHPIGRVKLAKLFYLVQQKAELELTETFAKRVAGPLDDDIHKFLSLASKKKWIALGKDSGDLKPVYPGSKIQEAVSQVNKFLGIARTSIDAMIEHMRGWGWKALERWATVLEATEELIASDKKPTVQNIKEVIQKYPVWKDKLEREEFSDDNIASTLKGLQNFGFIRKKLC